MAWKSYQKKRSYRKKPKAYRKKAARLSKPVKLAVKNAVSRMAETKQSFYTANFDMCAYTGNNSSFNFIPLTPVATGGMFIDQGTGEGQRVGNRIRVVKAVLKYVIYPKAYDATTNPTPIPQDIILRLFTSKKNTTSLVTSVPGYFDAGSSEQTPTGTVADINRLVNTTLYSEYAVRKHKLGFAQNTGSGAVIGQAYMSNNDYKYNIVGTIDYTKHIPKIMTWDDNLSANPSSRLLEIFAEAVHANGGVQGAQTTTCTFQYTMTLWYKDL